MTHTNRIPTALFVLAHQDDEYFALPWICREIAAGVHVGVVFLTNGGLRTNPLVRNEESTRALRRIGIAENAIAFLGTRGNVPDGKLINHLQVSYDAIRRWIADSALIIERIYAPDWEGGHPDHDAAHAIALSLAEALNAEGWGFSLYNAFKAPAKFFRVLNLLPHNRTKQVTYSWSTALQYALFCWRYRSQWKTWLGLFPESFTKRMLRRSERVNAFDLRRLQRPPHDGQLLYERMFATDYDAVARLTNAFRSTLRSPR